MVDLGLSLELKSNLGLEKAGDHCCTLLLWLQLTNHYKNSSQGSVSADMDH